MKSLARSNFWWPNIDSDIELLAANCAECQRTSNDPTSNSHPWQWPTRPWERLHIDYAGPFMEHYFLIVVDSHSKWLEIIPAKSITASKTIEQLRTLFAGYGIPVSIVSDNGTNFVSDEFQYFLASNGIRHIRTAPYSPQSNGLAERCVQTAQQAIRKMKNERGSINEKLAKFLLHYRRTPHATTSESPCMLLMKRQLRTRLDLLVPNLASKVKRKQELDIRDKNKNSFQINQKVAIKMFGPDKWKFGTIISRDSDSMYTVKLGNEILRRSCTQLRMLGQQIPLDVDDDLPEFTVSIPQANIASSESKESEHNANETASDNNIASNGFETSNSPVTSSSPENSNSSTEVSSSVPIVPKSRRGRGPARDYGAPTRRSERIKNQTSNTS